MSHLARRTVRALFLSAAFGLPGVAAAANGTVVDLAGTGVSEAHVRVLVFDNTLGRYRLTDEPHVMSDAGGAFAFDAEGGWVGPVVTAGRPGFLNYGATLGASDTTVTIFDLPADDPTYGFIAPTVCAGCHVDLHAQWSESLHANAANDWWVYQMLDAIDANGEPDGVGFRADRPGELPPCASCHAPAAAARAGGEVDLSSVAYADRHGVDCDGCHKVASVEVNDLAGVNGALAMLRPGDDYWSALIGQPVLAENIMFAFGPFEDAGYAGPMLASYNPAMRTSAFCSGCHQHANESGVPNMSTYEEWEAGPVAKAGIQCQDCHMGVGELTAFVQGHMAEHEVARPASIIYSHGFTGTTETWLGGAAEIELEIAEWPAEVIVTARVSNSAGGHALPTGMPIRNVLLLLEARGPDGAALELLEGPRLPDYAGEGDPAGGNYAGLPGRGFARVLVDAEGNRGVWFWSAVDVAEDTRIAAGATDESTYRFAKPAEGGRVDVEAKLLYRRSYKPLADAKGWLDGNGWPGSATFRPYEVEMGLATAAAEVAPPELPGGCGCRVGVARGPAPGAGAALVALLAAAATGAGLRARRSAERRRASRSATGWAPSSSAYPID